MFSEKAIRFCKRLNLRLPIIQAPMAGDVVTTALIKEVAKNGGLGSLPLGYLSLDEARVAIRQTLKATKSPFAVNIFIPSPSIVCPEQKLTKMLNYVNQQRGLLNLPPLLSVNPAIEPDIETFCDMILEEGITIVSFTFGIIPKKLMKKLHEKKVFVMGTATTVSEGLALEESGCQAVIAQGYEAGGHRGGGFLEHSKGGYIGTMALIPQMVDALRIPVIASGGIMDGRGIVAAMVLGASAIQLGTAFLTCEESNASAVHKQMILSKPAEETCITSSFTGKAVRCIKNEWVNEVEKYFIEEEIPPYPLQHDLTKELRRYANKSGQIAQAGLWSGQGTQLSPSLSVEDFMEMLEKQMIAAISEFK